MLFDDGVYRDMYLVFMESRYFGDMFLKAGFKHVYAIERQAIGWQCTDPSKSDLHTYILPAAYESDVMGVFKKNNPTFKILHIHVKPHERSIYPRFGVLSCVNIIQYMIGVYWPFILTPHQLYNKIKNSTPKHIEVIEWHDTQSTKHSEKQRPQHQRRIL